MEETQTNFKNKELKLWNINDTKDWLNEFKKKIHRETNEINDGNIDLSRFEWDGQQLSLFNIDDFQRMSPYGIALYRFLYSLPKNEKLENLNIDIPKNELSLSFKQLEKFIINKTVLIRVGTIHTFITLGAGCRIGKNLILTTKNIAITSTKQFEQDKIIFNVGIVDPNKWVNAKLLDFSNDQINLALLEITDYEPLNYGIQHPHHQDSSNSSEESNDHHGASGSGRSSSNSNYSNQKQQHDEKEKKEEEEEEREKEKDKDYEKNHDIYNSRNLGIGKVHDRGHTVNSSEFTSPSFDYHHLNNDEKEKEKQEFEIICNIEAIEMFDSNQGLLGRDILLCGFPKDRIDTVLCQELKIKIDTIYPSIEKATISFGDKKLIEINSTPEPGYSESSVLFDKSNAKFIGLVKSQYSSNPSKYYCIPPSTIINWLNQSFKKNNINLKLN